MIWGYKFPAFVCAVLCTAVVSAAQVKVKEKQPWTGVEGSRRTRLPDFKTFGT
jgi:hypothetical protein